MPSVPWLSAAGRMHCAKTALLDEKVRELADCNDQLEVAREAEEEYERRLDELEARSRRSIHALEVRFASLGLVRRATGRISVLWSTCLRPFGIAATSALVSLKWWCEVAASSKFCGSLLSYFHIWQTTSIGWESGGSHSYHKVLRSSRSRWQSPNLARQVRFGPGERIFACLLPSMHESLERQQGNYCGVVQSDNCWVSRTHGCWGASSMV